MPSYLVTGGSGQLGQCFQAVTNEFSEINLFFASRNEVDITRSRLCRWPHRVAPGQRF